MAEESGQKKADAEMGGEKCETLTQQKIAGLRAFVEKAKTPAEFVSAGYLNESISRKVAVHAINYEQTSLELEKLGYEYGLALATAGEKRGKGRAKGANEKGESIALEPEEEKRFAERTAGIEQKVLLLHKEAIGLLEAIKRDLER